MYKVKWVIDIDADSPVEAARKALAVQRDPESTATIFDVADQEGNAQQVDLMNEIEHHSTASQLLDQLDNGEDTELLESLARDLIDEHRQTIEVIRQLVPYVPGWNEQDFNARPWLQASKAILDANKD